MPQTVAVRLHKTITLAANDLCTINYSGRSKNGSVLIKNSGPGVVWLSMDPVKPASVGNVDNFFLKTGESVSMTGLDVSAAITLNADTASTVVGLSFAY